MNCDEWSDQEADEAATMRREWADGISVDRAIRALLHRRRRYIVRYLPDRADDLVTTEEVVEAVIAAEGRAGSSARRREAVDIDVRCIQLPHLVDAGVVESDDETGQVRYLPTPRIERLVECIEGL